MRFSAYKTTASTNFYLNQKEIDFLGITDWHKTYFLVGGNWDNVIVIRLSTQTAYENASKRSSGYYKASVDGAQLKVTPAKTLIKYSDGSSNIRDIECRMEKREGENLLVVYPQGSVPVAQPFLPKTEISNAVDAAIAKQVELIETPPLPTATLVPPSLENVPEEPKLERRMAEIAESLLPAQTVERKITVQHAKDHGELKGFGVELNEMLALVPTLFIGLSDDGKLQLEREEIEYEAL